MKNMDTVTNSLYRYQIKCQTSSCVCVVSSPPTLKVKPTWAGFCQIVCRNSIRNAQLQRKAKKNFESHPELEGLEQSIGQITIQMSVAVKAHTEYEF